MEIVGPDLARRLVDTQFPDWAPLPLTLVEPAGSDHTIYRLGDELSVRFPRHEGAIEQAVKEMEWLPRLAPHLPLTVPVPVAVGGPDAGYPWSWAVARWLPGSVATVEALGSSVNTAIELAEFLLALQAVPTETANFVDRPLSDRDTRVRSDISETVHVFDPDAMTAVWEAALAAPPWDRPPVWYHGDFHTGNLLTIDGKLSAVIDFGGLGVGDPACDLMMAYTLMDSAPREAFRSTLALDDATWARGRGIALASGLSAYTAYAATNPRVRAATTRQIRAALAS